LFTMKPLIYTNRPLIPCPSCAAVSGRFLQYVSHGSLKDYYRCDDCGHLWTRDKIEFTPAITARRKPDRRREPRDVASLVAH